MTPTIIVLALLVLIGTNVPSIAPLLQDPYTIWKNAQGQEVRVFLGDKAIPSNLTPQNTGNASSGYSREDGKLGGGFDYDFSPMMTVSTSQRSYWRGESKASYTGEGWVDADRIAGNNRQFVGKGAPLEESVDRSKAETVEVNQIVSLIREDPYPVLFGAAPISKVNWVDDEEAAIQPRSLAWFPTEWELAWNNPETYPSAYSITSTVTVLDEEGLKTADAAFPEQALHRMYTELPGSLPDRVRALAQQVSASGTSDYEKARLIEDYLRTNFVYNNKPDLTKLTGESDDFVDQFLFELMEGYCDYFSSAMAVMARSLDMPARWVKGFAPGVLPAEQYGPGEMLDGEDYNPSGAGMYTVRNSDAHSWVEIYFQGYGWISFEATAGFSFPYMIAEDEAAPAPTVAPVEELPTTGNESTTESNGSVWPIVALSAILGGGAVWLILRRRDLPAIWNKLRGRDYSANEQIVVETNRLLRQCRKRGLQREEHETLREAILRWSKSQKRFTEDFRYVLDSFEHAKYSQAAVTREEAERFAGKVRYLIGELK
ncbi:MAG: transglutaminase domain protein [Paenibacillus sp.]|nr:transglutaminase domain protein [Paenibacillus sp.]